MRLETLKISKPKLVAYLLLGVFWVTGTLPYFISLVSKTPDIAATSYMALLGDFAVLLLGVLTIRRPGWILLTLLLLVITYISTITVNGLSLIHWLNGLRYYLPMVCLPPAIRYLLANKARRNFSLDKFDKSLYIFLWIQVPCMLQQFITYGAGDYGGGSLGNLNSGIISAMIYLASFYLMKRRWDQSLSILTNLRRNWTLLFLLFPSFLNETTISFLFLIMYFVLLVPVSLRNAKQIPFIIIGFCVILGGGLVTYQNTLGKSNKDILSMAYMADYVFGDEILQELVLTYVEKEQNDEVTKDYARGLKFAILPLVLKDKPWTPYIGFGVGQFKGGNFMEKTYFAKRFDFLVSGTQMMGMIWLLELGWTGIAWVVLYLIVLFHVPRGSQPQRKLRLYLLGFILMMIAYTFIFASLPISILFFYTMEAANNWQYFRDRPLTLPFSSWTYSS